MPKKRKVEADEDLNSDTKPTENVHVKNSSSPSKEDLTKLLEPFTKQHLIQILLATAFDSPKVLKEINQVADLHYVHCKLFVHGLNQDTTTLHRLQLFFSKYGEIEDSWIIVDKETRRSKGYGFIVFKTREGAEKAMKDCLKMLDNRFIYCNMVSDRNSNTRPTQQELFERKIYVGNVHTEIPADKLFDLFSKYGEIEKGPLGFDINTGKPKGFAFFIYKTVEGAKKALEEPIKSLTGYPLMYCGKHNKGSSPSPLPLPLPLPTPALHECGVHYNPGFTSMGSFRCGGAGGLRGCSGGLLGCGGCGHGVGCRGTGSVGGGGGSNVAAPKPETVTVPVPAVGGVGGDMQGGTNSLFTMFMFHLFFILFCFVVLISK